MSYVLLGLGVLVVGVMGLAFWSLCAMAGRCDDHADDWQSAKHGVMR